MEPQNSVQEDRLQVHPTSEAVHQQLDKSFSESFRAFFRLFWTQAFFHAFFGLFHELFRGFTQLRPSWGFSGFYL
jgi:hypothetical protein